MTPAEVAERLEARRTGPGQWEARCPAHEDRRASLAIGTGQDGRVLLRCHAGCELAVTLQALGLRIEDLQPQREAVQPRRIAATYDYLDETGALLYQVVRYEPKDFRQRAPDGHGGWVWRLAGIRRVLYRLPELLTADDCALVFIVEGEKDVENLRRLRLVATTNAQGAGKWSHVAAHAREVLTGRHVVIIPDNDDTGRRHAVEVGRGLRGAAASIRYLEIPGLPPKGDASNWTSGGGTADALRQLASVAPHEPPAEWCRYDGTPSERSRHDAPRALSPPEPPLEAADALRGQPEIVIGTDEDRVVDAAVAALAPDPLVFQRDSALVRVLDDGDALPKVQRVPTAALRERLAAAAKWIRINAKEERAPAHPPEWAVRELEARATWPGLRRLTAIVTAPALRPDGSVISTPGFDTATGILFIPRSAFPAVPLRPEQGDVRAAVELLREPLADFPFRSDADRAAAISVVLTIVARQAIDGPVPLYPVRAPSAGTGKSLLGNALTLAATGRLPRTIPSPPADNAEWKKMILAIALEAPAVVAIDNVEGELGSPALAAAITTGEIDERILGKNEMGGGKLRTVWLGSGNNISFRMTLARRVVVIDLESPLERPEDRTGFRHPDLLSHVRQVWPLLVTAALTILRAYHVAGRPAHGKPRLGSFEAWDSLIRGACVWAGIGDPDAARERTRAEADADGDALRPALDAWRASFGGTPTTTANACKAAAADSELEAALSGIVRGQLTPKALGFALRRVRRKIVAGWRFEAWDGHGGTLRWYAECAIEERRHGGDGGNGGDENDPFAREIDRLHIETGRPGPGASPPSPPSPPCDREPCDREPGEDDDQGEFDLGAPPPRRDDHGWRSGRGRGVA